MASELISRKTVLSYLNDIWYNCKGSSPLDDAVADALEIIFKEVEHMKAVDAIPIDDVAEMLLDLFGDGCPCNYNDIDEMLSLDCAGDCPADGNPICWRKYVRVWMERKRGGGKQDAD